MGPTEQIFWTWIAAILTLAIYSFLYKDNPLYKFAEHLLVGASVGYSLALSYTIVLKPRIFMALANPDASWGTKFVRVILPTLMGLCYVGFFTRNHSWVARFPIAFVMGLGSGLALPMTMLASILRQMRGTFAQEVDGALQPLISIDLFRKFGADPSITSFLEAFYGPLLIIGVLSVMLIFIFSVEHKGPLKAAGTIGMLYLMIGFGAAFGYTVMARISLLVGRIDFLLGDWLNLI